MLCGSASVNWDIAALVASYIQRHSTINRQWGFPESYFTNAYYMRRRFWLQNVSLPSLLSWGRSFQATNPLDRVYGLMGLPAFVGSKNGWEANYSMSKVELYKEVAVGCIEETQSLRVLSYAQHVEDPSFPSWVPQWDRQEKYRAINDSLTKVHWSCSGDRKLSMDYNIDKGLLKLKGIVFDTVKQSCPLGETLSLRSQKLKDHPILKLWETTRGHLATYPGGGTHLEALSLTLATGLHPNLRKASDSNNMKSFKKHFAAYLCKLLEGSGYIPDASLKIEGESGDWSEYDTLLRRQCPNRSLLFTENGYIGLGPPCHSGDYVCILFGGETPFILRPKQADYQLIGDTYVHGIMEGEAVKSLGTRVCGEIDLNIY
jgi:hypothetical protein